MEGYLRKWINIVSGWKQRYFIIHDGLLTYCEHKGSETEGVIYLKIASIQAIPEDPLRIVINSGTSEVHIRTSSMAEKIKWFNALKEGQELALKEDDEKKYPEDEIQVVEGRLSVGAKALLSESNLDKVKDELAELWVKQSQFDEVLSLLQPKLDKMAGIGNLAQRLEELGRDLKV